MAGLLDTQNQHWAADKSKFGYRMLQKMGWKEGKGLGVKEDGATEHVRPRRRAAVHGLGATAPDTAWHVPAAVASGLNDVLAGLAPVTADPVDTEPPRPARPPKAARARGFYGRRAAGKDVRNYSEKDLAEIFGGTTGGETRVGTNENDRTGEECAVSRKERRKRERIAERAANTTSDEVDDDQVPAAGAPDFGGLDRELGVEEATGRGRREREREERPLGKPVAARVKREIDTEPVTKDSLSRQEMKLEKHGASRSDRVGEDGEDGKSARKVRKERKSKKSTKSLSVKDRISKDKKKRRKGSKEKAR